MQICHQIKSVSYILFHKKHTFTSIFSVTALVWDIFTSFTTSSPVLLQNPLNWSPGIHTSICSQISCLHYSQPEKTMAPHSGTLAWKIPWTEEPGGLQPMESLRLGHDFTFTFTFHFHALEKEMATHSSVLAWRIPGMGEPGGLLSLGLHRVRHDWSDLAAAAAALQSKGSFKNTNLIMS